MTLSTNRRSLLLGASALGATALLGASGQPLHAQTPTQGGTLRLGIGSFDSGETLDPQVAETKFMQNLQWQLRNNLIEVLSVPTNLLMKANALWFGLINAV